VGVYTELGVLKKGEQPPRVVCTYTYNLIVTRWDGVTPRCDWGNVCAPEVRKTSSARPIQDVQAWELSLVSGGMPAVTRVCVGVDG
jgi:hypothetical protein